ncbi:DNA cytosine methyltransferase [Telmatospirillum sp. J64-1]|uniref:DNA cytosine methyltransferase n=1 Tax=Telmatospirillum sp. J64-1 TaxID=2502183 RepID=UPI00115C5E92|nr:DNA cytosine methyltransferase [Telmatospirillum sp. J64-1]
MKLDLFAGHAPAILARPEGREIIVDSFAGGGGASTGIEMALGRSPDVAINHDPEAVAMHAINHPGTVHYCQNIWQVNPAEVASGRPIGLAWFSPDCKHFSKAKGGKPRSKNIRDLAWIVVAYAKLPRHIRPRVICLENVEEFQSWGPLLEDGAPCPERKGETFRQWVGELKRLGYRVEWRELRACDYGAPTIRKRLFLVARMDGEPIVWPAPTHGAPDSGEVVVGNRQPWRTAAEIIEWSVPCRSIFDRDKPLAEATMRRIFNGLNRYILNHADPFIIPVTHQGDYRVHGIHEPVRTITTAKRGELALIAPFLTKFRNGSIGSGIEEPVHTITCSHSNHHPGGAAPIGLVAAWLAQHNTGVTGHDAREPVSTVLGTGSHQGLVTSHLVKLRGTCADGQSVNDPLHTISAQGQHFGEVRAFLTKYYSQGAPAQDCRDPLHTIPTRDRFGLVTVAGTTWQIADIGLRMLTPRELYRAQGFPDSYIIDFEYGGRPLPKYSQVRMCGNSVCPPMAAAMVGANAPELAVKLEAAQ